MTHGVEERKQKVLFLTRIGQTAYSKLKTLVSPSLLADLSLDTIFEKLAEHLGMKVISWGPHWQVSTRWQQVPETDNDTEG